MKQFHLHLNPPHLPTDWPGADWFQQDNSTGKSWISKNWILMNTYFIWSTYSTLLSRSRGQRQHEFSCLRLRCSCCFCQQHFLSTVGQFTFIRCWQTWPGLTIANLLLESVRKHWEILSFLSWAGCLFAKFQYFNFISRMCFSLASIDDHHVAMISLFSLVMVHSTSINLRMIAGSKS